MEKHYSACMRKEQLEDRRAAELGAGIGPAILGTGHVSGTREELVLNANETVGKVEAGGSRKPAACCASVSY